MPSFRIFTRGREEKIIENISDSLKNCFCAALLGATLYVKARTSAPSPWQCPKRRAESSREAANGFSKRERPRKVRRLKLPKVPDLDVQNGKTLTPRSESAMR